jgi:Mg-chelatase subunit ChlD
VERLDLRQNRVGLVSFTIRSRWRRDALIPRLTDKPGVIVPVGKAEAVLAALADFPPAQERMRTDLSRLLERGAELLDAEATQIQPIRPRAILLLYLGQPSAPDGIHFSSRRAVERAAALGERGISIWAIPLRPGDIAYLDELTSRSGGGVIGLNQLDARFGVPRSEGP